MNRPQFLSGGRYPVLRSLAILYLIGAGVSILAGIVGIGWSLIRAPGDMADRLVLAGGVLAGSFFLCITMLAMAELLKLFIDMEHNTRASAMAAMEPMTSGAGEPMARPETPADATMRPMHTNRLHALDEETAEAALLRGH